MRIVTLSSLPWPVDAAADRCAAATTSSGRTDPGPCARFVTGQAFVQFPYDGAVWRVFLCARHGAQVDGSELLDDVGTAELGRRRNQAALALAGRPFCRPEPLAHGQRIG